MPTFRPRKNYIFPFLILFERIESIDMTPCVIAFLVFSSSFMYVLCTYQYFPRWGGGGDARIQGESDSE